MSDSDESTQGDDSSSSNLYTAPNVEDQPSALEATFQRTGQAHSTPFSDDDDGVAEGTHTFGQSNIGISYRKEGYNPNGEDFPSSTTNGHVRDPQVSYLGGDVGGAHDLEIQAQRKRKWSPNLSDATRVSSDALGQSRHIPNADMDREEVISRDESRAIDQTRFKRTRLDDGQPLTRPGRSPDQSPRALLAPSDKSNLPGEIWQHVFTFVPPASLGRLLRVHSAFNTLLNPSKGAFKGDSSERTTPRGLKIQSPNSVWSASRKLYCPGMPRPLSSLTELSMWRLVRGRNCQFCGKAGSSIPPTFATSPWEAGPGEKDVRIVWPFGVRSCGLCLKDRIEKEMDVLFSSTVPSILLPALPFAFFTPSVHLLSSVTLRSALPPPGLQLTKHYFKPHIDDIKMEFENVKAMGPATFEEWIKGLESTGKGKLADAARWEQWETNGGLRHVNSRSLAKQRDADVRAGPSAKPSGTILATSDQGSGQSTPVTQGKGPHGGSGASSPLRLQSVQNSGLPPRPVTPPSHQPFPHPLQHPLQYPMQHPMPQSRVERSLREVNEAKASRRAEIERRCLELDPPLAASVLSHMDSFSAATQIPQVFADRDWEVLKPRLLAQREIAERKEQERLMQSQLLHAKTEERRQQEAQLKEAKETLDREWENVQKPIRDRMSLYADELIRDNWHGGEAVTKEKCAKFAADVLMYVRNRFYSDISQEDALAIASGRPVQQDAPNAPPTRKLILENMKWIFDTKIKPLTEQCQKELFLCNGCENNSKFYGFEGVVQHFAAKHTNVLSIGSQVVHWRAEWPEHPPFHPNPSTAKSAFYAIPNPGIGTGPGYPGGPPPQSGPYMPGSDQGHHLPLEGAQIYPQPSPGPYGPPPYGGQYPPHQPPQYRPASPIVNNFYPGSQNFGYQSAQSGYPPTNGPYEAVPGPHQYSQHPMYGSPYPGHVYPVPYSSIDSRPTASYVAPPRYGAQPPIPSYPGQYPPQPQPGGLIGGAPNSNPPGQPFGLYQDQLDALAKIARDIWNATSGIKDLPSSVRVHVLIHHVSLGFKEKFTNEPNLALLTDGLNNHPQMRPIRTLNGLACKACLNLDNDPTVLYAHPQPLHGERKLYTIPALLSHFQAVHVERSKPSIIPQTGIEIPRLDWKVDMVELPETSVIASLINAPGMDNAKLQLIATVFPDAFPSPLPNVEPTTHAGPVPTIKGEEPDELLDIRNISRGPPPASQSRPTYLVEEKPAEVHSRHLSPHQRGLEVAIDNFPRFVDSPMIEPAKPAEPPRDDEYDPHRPAFIEPVDRFGPPEHRRSQAQHSPIVKDHFEDTIRREPSFLREYHPVHSNGMTPMAIDRMPIDFDRSEPRESFYDYSGQRIKPSDRTSPQEYPAYASADHPLSRPHAGSLGRSGPSPHINRERGLRGTAENVSEEGEVGEAPGRSKDENKRPSSPVEEMNPAERFLNTFDLEAAGPDREEEESSKNRWVTGADSGYLRDDASDNRSWRLEGAASGTGENSLRGTPTRSGPQNGWGGRNKSPVSGTINYRDYDLKHDGRGVGSHPGVGGLLEGSPELVDPRYVRKGGVIYQDLRHATDHPSRRPHSRFDRYEAQRQGSQRPRSRSPQAHGRIPVETAYYRERSPNSRPQRHLYQAQSPDAYRDRIPMEEPVTYARVPSHGQYQYVDEQRYVDTSYDGPIEYVPVRVAAREAQGSGAYYVERPRQREISKEYIGYEGDYHRQPVFEHNGQLYRASTRSQDAQDPQDPLPRHVRYR